jgi:malic enzyme
MSRKEDALEYHRRGRKGKLEVVPTKPLVSQIDLSNAYTPGVAEPCLEIAADDEKSWEYTARGNLVAVISNGTAVLGLGDIGPAAGKPVMEGKACLFKKFADIDVFDLEIAEKDVDKFVDIVAALEPTFGGINLEDISAPACFEIEEKLRARMHIPVFHDDQHGTAVIALAALVNALDVVGKKIDKIKAVIAGAGSAGYGIYRILERAGCRDIIVADSKGAIYEGRADINVGNNRYRQEIAEKTNAGKTRGGIEDVIRGADLFIGASGKGNIVSQDMVRTMNKDAIVFALSNPDPEILPPEALDAGARIAATGRSDFANQINNAVVFPSVLRALLDLRARYLDEDMLVSVAFAIASLVDRKHMTESFIIPRVNDPRILPIVTQTLRDAVTKHLDAKGQAMPQ